MKDPNALWKDILLQQLNLMPNSDQGLALFGQTQILSRHENLQNHNNEMFV